MSTHTMEESIANPIERMSWRPRSMARIIKSVNGPDESPLPSWRVFLASSIAVRGAGSVSTATSRMEPTMIPR